MSTNDLDQLDQRGRAAAADLHQRAAGRRRPTFDPGVTADLEAPVPLVRPRRRASDPRWLAAAAVIVVALVGAAVWAAGSGDDEDPTDVTTTEIRPWRPTVLPDGLELAGAGEITAADVAAAERGDGPLAIYGPSVDDPRVGVARLAEWSPDSEDASRPIEVDGRTVYALTEGGLPTATVVVEAPGGDGWIALVSGSLDADELAQLAVHARRDGAAVVLDGAALPDGWRHLGDEPDGLFLAIPVAVMRGSATSASFLVAFADQAAAGGSSSSSSSGSSSSDGSDAPSDDQTAPEPLLPDPGAMVTVASLVGDEVRLQALRLVVDDVEEIEVRGHPALLATTKAGDGLPDQLSISWLEAPGELLRIGSWGVEREELLRLAESVEPVPAAEWDDLVDRSMLGDLPGSFDGDERGDEIARGSLDDGTAWILRASDRDGDVITAVGVDLALGGDSTSSVSGSAGAGGERGPGVWSSQVIQIDGRTVAAGIVGSDVAAVQLRTLDGQVVADATVGPLGDGTGASWFVVEVPGDGRELALLDADGTLLETSTLDGALGAPQQPTTATSLVGEPVEPSGPAGEPTVSVETTVGG